MSNAIDARRERSNGRLLNAYGVIMVQCGKALEGEPTAEDIKDVIDVLLKEGECLRNDARQYFLRARSLEAK